MKNKWVNMWEAKLVYWTGFYYHKSLEKITIQKSSSTEFNHKERHYADKRDSKTKSTFANLRRAIEILFFFVIDLRFEPRRGLRPMWVPIWLFSPGLVGADKTSDDAESRISRLPARNSNMYTVIIFGRKFADQRLEQPNKDYSNVLHINSTEQQNHL